MQRQGHAADNLDIELGLGRRQEKVPAAIKARTLSIGLRLPVRTRQRDYANPCFEATHGRMDRRDPIQLSLGCGLQDANIKFPHGHEGLDHPARDLGIRIAEQLDHANRYDLPRQAKAILEPTALAFFSPGGELVPEVIDLGLSVR